MLNIIEETESQYKSELKLWENQHGNIWLEVGYFDPEDPISTHGIELTEDDVVALIKELTRLVGYVPTSQIRSTQSEIQKPESKQLTIDGVSPSKVNWGGK